MRQIITVRSRVPNKLYRAYNHRKAEKQHERYHRERAKHYRHVADTAEAVLRKDTELTDVTRDALSQQILNLRAAALEDDNMLCKLDHDPLP